jgi:hypothetical protein
MKDTRGPFPYAAYIFRILHVIPVCLLSGQIVFSCLFLDKEREPMAYEKTFYGICGAMLLISGLVNSHILDTSKMAPKSTKLFWIKLVLGKLMITVLFFTPLFTNFVVPLLRVSPQQAKQIQAALLLIILLVSSFLRFYREWKSKPLKDQ